LLDKPKTPRDEAYKEFVRQHDCLDCRWPHELGGIEAHHIKTGGMAIKCSDYETVPLCSPSARGCHRKADKDEIHIKRYELAVERLNREWECLKEKKDI
jgi:hypothetical protein